ncbi:hypothetical protein ACWT_6541 [Actinoplanes sp. SE50]|uniref:hypothetical protein n=1 Tax=unclassified Actinoplanes TaxID=2626549 RepID=UPI00023EC36F|nr:MULTISPECIES: hypothetical protein [unclassified Actinoplanes]AEV87553.1 hypothetical protein ACPL_6671 [Actinoplanes sp. SE50/110]ATO85956.1 hypothetical protein ACWT_6541 [Actinoplanes sp. SE50]SLM03370.1 hypothetical protein ACSP50_6659 [Actinoplanes sp. SE50/110]
MDSAFLNSVPQAVAIWLIIVLLLAVAAATVSVPRVLTEPAPDVTDRERYAGEVAIAAGRARATADRRRADWQAAQQAVDDAWAAYEKADRVARRIAAAGVYPLLDRRRKPGENVDRERFLHRAASELCRSQDLSIDQLNDVFAHRGWNPRLHPVQQEWVLAQAVRANRLTGYREAVERERAAWRSADAAAEALRGLRAEAMAAPLLVDVPEPADQQWWTEQWTTADLPASAAPA